MRESASAAVSPQTATVEQGEVILRAGDIVSPEDVEALEQIGLLTQQWDLWSLLRALIFAILLVAVTVGAMYRLRPQTATSAREVIILVVLTMVWLVTAKFMIVPHNWLPYLYPLAALSMLVACLVDVRTAVLLTVAFALIILYLSDASAVLVVYGAMGGIAGALVLGRADRLTAFLWAALAVTVCNFLSVLAFRLPFDAMSNQQILQLGFVLLLNGGLSASIALLGYFGLGNLFGLTTSLQLNELSRPTHPLLRQLLLKASGTYHHTIVVSNLAERAAAAIGADALLARVGAYYHDIGKTVRPYFFTENIGEDSSPHDKLDPLTSAQIIISHVSDGLDLAQKYRLPRRLHDFIREHHGTSLVQYFYNRAVRAAVEGETVDETDFRYPGPKPRSRETAILALADTCEAAVRAMRPATREDLAALVNRLIDERVAEGELSESSLTFKDLAAIRVVFVQVLQGVHHPRIRYPQPLGANETAGESATENTPLLPPMPGEALAETEASTGRGHTYAGVEEMPESEAMISVDKAG
jgi:putative nucleotidyltransferase with HDIG domain